MTLDIVYYAAKDQQKESMQDQLTYYKLFDQHYKEFLSASTLLASLVPPVLREEVLKVEDTWDEINDSGFGAVPEVSAPTLQTRSVQR
jgi:hypothetical protein